MKKGVWRSQISWLFLIHYELSENQKNFFWFFTVFWGDLEGAGWFSPPPLSSNIQEARPIRVKKWIFFNLNPVNLVLYQQALPLCLCLLCSSHGRIKFSFIFGKWCLSLCVRLFNIKVQQTKLHLQHIRGMRTQLQNHESFNLATPWF